MTEPVTPSVSSADITPKSSGITLKPLKHHQILFIQAYMLTKSAAEAVRRCGYKGKHAHVSGYKMLQHPSVKAEIERLQRQQTEAIEEKVEAKLEAELKSITKDTFIDKALKDYESLPVDHANRMRALDLAGRGAGIIGKDGSTTTHNTLIVNVDAKSLPAEQRWDRLRALIDGS